MEFWKKNQEEHNFGNFGNFGSFGKNHEEEDNNFGNFGKIQEEEDHGFEGMTRKKKMALGALEKTMKNKTMTLKFWP
jgi:hypothetical protein